MFLYSLLLLRELGKEIVTNGIGAHEKRLSANRKMNPFQLAATLFQRQLKEIHHRHAIPKFLLFLRNRMSVHHYQLHKKAGNDVPIL